LAFLFSELGRIAKSMGIDQKLSIRLGIGDTRSENPCGFDGRWRKGDKESNGKTGERFVCGNLFDNIKYAYKKASEWSSRRKEFVKRAGFVLMVELEVHDKRATRFLLPIQREAGDGMNFLAKAVNWALRQIEKRNTGLRRQSRDQNKRNG
jgi:hypothetical protein